MEPQIVQVIHELCPQDSPLDRILFTGHSLGGAIAQLFYLLTSTKGTLMQKTISG